jgi:hypothetical protein
MLFRVLHVQKLGSHFDVSPFGASATDTIPVWTVDFFCKHDKPVFFENIKVICRPHLWKLAKVVGFADLILQGQFVCLDKNLSNVFLDPILKRVPLAPFTVVERERDREDLVVRFALPVE